MDNTLPDKFRTMTNRVNQLVNKLNLLTNRVINLEGLRTFNVGDSITFPNQSAVFSGYVTASAKVLHFYVPAPKPIKGVTSATVTGQIGIRTTQGIMTGAAISLADYTVNSTITAYGVEITVRSEATYTTVVNNTAVSVSPSTAGLKITFS